MNVGAATSRPPTQQKGVYSTNMDTVPLSLPMILDGATGTELYKRGMPHGVCTEQWVLEHPEAILDLQRKYVQAGTQVLIAPTFGANRVNLGRHHIENKVEEYNKQLIALSRQAADGKALVAADLTGVGLFIPPFGETGFEELVDIYTQQARACEEAGCDLFLIETQTSLPEARAAVLAVKSVSDKPVWVTFTVDENGRTMMGTDVLAAMIVMQGMGVAAFGLNCSTGPETMLEQLERLTPYAAVPLIAKPNAGLPETVDGKTVYRCSPVEFTSHVQAMADAGVRIFGGCCGTAPEHIAALKQAVDAVDFDAIPDYERDLELLPCASEKEARFLTADVDIGEPIECSPDLMEDILDAEESGDGAIKIAIYGQDDLDIFAENQYAIQEALCIETDVPELLEGALRAYQGRALWDGTCEMEDSFLLDMSIKYGLIVL